MNTWTVVAKSAEFAFGWTDRELQLMQMWIYISYLIAMLPFAWLLDKKGEYLNFLSFGLSDLCSGQISILFFNNLISRDHEEQTIFNVVLVITV